MRDVEAMKKALLMPRVSLKERLQKAPKVSTGSTLLNLAISDRVDGGFPAGGIVLLVGDSTSGKTFLTLTCFAEAQLTNTFKNYRIIFDDVENGCTMDLEAFFGKKVAEKMEPPHVWEDGEPIYSESVEDFYDNIEAAGAEGTPFIYVLDSENALTSEAEEKKSKKNQNARATGQDTTGSMSDGKAKQHSTRLRRMVRLLRRTKSILIIISQTRDNMGFGAQFQPKTRSGGRALRFYNHIELWTSLAGRIKKTVKGKPRNVGIRTKVKVEKNRMTGYLTETVFPLYNTHGIDDLQGMIEYLIEEKRWSKAEGGTAIDTKDDFGMKASLPKLIKHIEENELEADLRDIVQEVWDDIREACKPDRKKRYV